MEIITAVEIKIIGNKINVTIFDKKKTRLDAGVASMIPLNFKSRTRQTISPLKKTINNKLKIGTTLVVSK